MSSAGPDRFARRLCVWCNGRWHYGQSKFCLTLFLISLLDLKWLQCVQSLWHVHTHTCMHACMHILSVSSHSASRRRSTWPTLACSISQLPPEKSTITTGYSCSTCSWRAGHCQRGGESIHSNRTCQPYLGTCSHNNAESSTPTRWYHSDDGNNDDGTSAWHTRTRGKS